MFKHVCNAFITYGFFIQFFCNICGECIQFGIYIEKNRPEILNQKFLETAKPFDKKKLSINLFKEIILFYYTQENFLCVLSFNPTLKYY